MEKVGLENVLPITENIVNPERSLGYPSGSQKETDGTLNGGIEERSINKPFVTVWEGEGKISEGW